MNKHYVSPSPIVDTKEGTALTALTDRYNKMIEPSVLSKGLKKVGAKAIEIVPTQVKDIAKGVAHSISEAEVYSQVMKMIVESFDLAEKQVAKHLISETAILKMVNEIVSDNEITSISEICFARGYDIGKIVNKYKTGELVAAAAEGAATGYFGFAGIPANLLLSTLLYYHAVQSIAMFYGYDVKNDPAELVIASEVFSSALSQGEVSSSEISNVIAKIMILSETSAIKQAVGKTWTDLAARGGLGLLIVQMRALANKAAQKALNNVGAKTLQNSLFKEVFEQIGKRLSKEAVKKAMPGVSAVIGAGFDAVQMNKVLEFADVFYQKRFILEKEIRISTLLGEVLDTENVLEEV